MNIYYDIRRHLNIFEGTADEEPEADDIEMLLMRRGYSPANIEIRFDDFQNIWRFTGNLI